MFFSQLHLFSFVYSKFLFLKLKFFAFSDTASNYHRLIPLLYWWAWWRLNPYGLSASSFPASLFLRKPGRLLYLPIPSHALLLSPISLTPSISTSTLGHMLHYMRSIMSSSHCDTRKLSRFCTTTNLERS